MSIWASLHTLTPDTGTAPVAYQGNGHLPRRSDERRGYLDLAHVPGHITPAGEPERDRPWPWLRLTVNGTVTVLDVDQATELATVLGDWLADQPPHTP